jgi:NTP pyrophosphatase (non-canonical NTP hydrolase)
MSRFTELEAEIAALKAQWNELVSRHALLLQRNEVAEMNLEATARDRELTLTSQLSDQAAEITALKDGVILSRDFVTRRNAWADKQFPQSTQLSRSYHLQAEVRELIEALESGSDNVVEEVGDCINLLLHIASHGGIDIEAELERKLIINKGREWGAINAKGFVEHVR